MNILTEHLAALTNLGYNEQEARFLYLVATHSGYFTLRQYLDFIGTTKGWKVHQFTSKAIRLGHVRVIPCGRQTSLFNVYSRKIYGALDRDNLRNRRRLSNELIRTRLLILDFVLAHPALQYLETEHDKVHFFREQLAVPESLLPGRIYKGIYSDSTTKRYFVDRFPIFIFDESKNLNTSLVPTFIYCHSSSQSLLHYLTHVRHYHGFLQRLTAFHFVYAAPTTTKFQRAEQLFRNLFIENSSADAKSLTRYFRVRRLWDENKHGLLTRADRDLLRLGKERYSSPFFESACRQWSAGSLSDTALYGLLTAEKPASACTFRTHFLPRDYDIFGSSSQISDRTPVRNQCSAPRSVSGSDEEQPKHL